MNLIKYPNEQAVNKAIAEKEPLLVLVSFDGETIIASQIDEAVEHHILLAKAGYKSTDIDRYFRVVVDDEAADWTFVCPPDYKGIPDKVRRIAEFYKDGFREISAALQALGLYVDINIPKRYRRHFDIMAE